MMTQSMYPSLKTVLLDEKHKNKRPKEILELSPSALIGVGQEGAAVLAKLQVKTIGQLGEWKFYKIATAIKVLASTESNETRNVNSNSNLNRALIKKWETKSFKEMLDAPLEAFQGFSKLTTSELKVISPSPSTVGELADWKFCKWSEALLELAKSVSLFEGKKTEPEEKFIAPSLPRRAVLPKASQSEIISKPGAAVPKPKRVILGRSKSMGTLSVYPRLAVSPKCSVKKVAQFFTDLVNTEGNVPPKTRRSLGRQLHQLVIKNDIANIMLLLQQGADPDGGGSQRPPLFTAVDLNNVEACEALLAYGASMVTSVSAGGMESNPLKLALSPNTDKAVTQVFLKHLEALEQTNIFKRTPEEAFDNDRMDDEPPRKVARSNMPTTPYS